MTRVCTEQLRRVAMTHAPGALQASTDDLEVLQQLNRDYVRSAETSDVRWYDEHLADDFLASNPDGSLVDRAEFLARMARPYPGSKLEAVDVRIRRFGELAIIHAGFRYEKANGLP